MHVRVHEGIQYYSISKAHYTYKFMKVYYSISKAHYCMYKFMKVLYTTAGTLYVQVLEGILQYK